jgi:isopentenyl-diphosphate Delta-isomerase
MTFGAGLGNDLAMDINSNTPLFEGLARRKSEHIELALKSQTPVSGLDQRFNYEPLFFTHPGPDLKWPHQFLAAELDYPVWISSMTGGTLEAAQINDNLARLCGKYRLGMGLGSCRPLLHSHERLHDFAVRKHLGDQPFFANLGIAQIEEYLQNAQTGHIHDMIGRLEATGLIIHLNPLQEWFQPEGDRFLRPPLETIKRFMETARYPVIVKEVGQGMGPKSLEALLELPLAGIEFGAFGGTNFSLLESMRQHTDQSRLPFTRVGHSAWEMAGILNALPDRKKDFIISGGINDVLDAHALLLRLKRPAVIGMASAFLAPARESFERLEQHFLNLREAMLTARELLTLKEEF